MTSIFAKQLLLVTAYAAAAVGVAGCRERSDAAGAGPAVVASEANGPTSAPAPAPSPVASTSGLPTSSAAIELARIRLASARLVMNGTMVFAVELDASGTTSLTRLPRKPKASETLAPFAVKGPVHALAADDDHLYLAFEHDLVRRSASDATSPPLTLATYTRAPDELRIRDGWVYLGTNETRGKVGGADGSIDRVAISGGPVQRLVSGVKSIDGFTVATSGVYNWSLDSSSPAGWHMRWQRSPTTGGAFVTLSTPVDALITPPRGDFAFFANHPAAGRKLGLLEPATGLPRLECSVPAAGEVSFSAVFGERCYWLEGHALFGVAAAPVGGASSAPPQRLFASNLATGSVLDLVGDERDVYFVWAETNSDDAGAAYSDARILHALAP